MEKKKRKAINLLKLWIACVILYSIGTSIYVSYQQVIVGNDPTIFVSGYHWFTLCVLVFFFLPLLCSIYYLARKTDSNMLRKIVLLILIWLLVFLGMFIICIIFAYMAPELFTKLTSLFEPGDAGTVLLSPEKSS